MSGFTSYWPTADPDAMGSSNTTPPGIGEFGCILQDARAFTSRKGDDYVAFTLTEVQSQHTWDVLHGFSSQGQANMTKNQAREVGVDIAATTSIEVLDAQLKACIGGYFKVEVVQSGDFLNTYIRGRVNVGGEQAAPAVVPPAQPPAQPPAGTGFAPGGVVPGAPPAGASGTGVEAASAQLAQDVAAQQAAAIAAAQQPAVQQPGPPPGVPAPTPREDIPF